MSTCHQKRILLFTHYNWRSELSEHVLYTLRSIRPLFDTLIVISNSPLCAHDHALLQSLTDHLLIRANDGFDFGAWKAGLEAIGWDAVRQADSLTLMNDSCFGPLFELEPLYRRMQEQGVDFWGLTNHRVSRIRIRWRIHRIPNHLQSYFLVFHRPVLQSPVFFAFWRKVGSHDDIWDVIIRFEVTLTRTLRRAGFSCVPMIDTTQEKGGNANWSHYHPDRLLARAVPFIKIKSIPLFFTPHALLEDIRSRSVYPIALLEDYFHRYYRPDISLLVTDAVVRPCPTGTSGTPIKTALHLHARDLDALQPILENGALWAKPMDVYVSVPDSVPCSQVNTAMQRIAPDIMVKAVLFYGEHEHPFVVHAARFETYEVVGYIPIGDGQVPAAAAHHRALQSTLLVPSDQWCALFAADPGIGLMCADQPALVLRHPSSPGVAEDLAFMKNALRGICGTRKLDAADLVSFVGPYGSAFWYRPDALAPMLEWLCIQTDAVRGKRTTNALRLLPIYSAWMQGYRFRIISATGAASQSVCHQQAIVDMVERLTRAHLPHAIQHHIARCLRRFWRHRADAFPGEACEKRETGCRLPNP